MILDPANHVPFHHAAALAASPGVLYPTKANLLLEYTLTSVMAFDEVVEVDEDGDWWRCVRNDSSDVEGGRFVTITREDLGVVVQWVSYSSLRPMWQ